MKTTYLNLRGRIAENGLNLTEAAAKLGYSVPALSAKLCGRTRFSTDDIKNICRGLGIKKAQIPDYFFEDMED